MNIKIGTMNGDVIESGAVKNVTNHYHYYGKEQEETALPEVLTTPQAEVLLDKLGAAGMVDARWQPTGLKGEQRGLLAGEVAARLGIATPWVLFGQLWGEKPDTLRSYFNKGMGSKNGTDFLDRLKQALKG